MAVAINFPQPNQRETETREELQAGGKRATRNFSSHQNHYDTNRSRRERERGERRRATFRVVGPLVGAQGGDEK